MRAVDGRKHPHGLERGGRKRLQIAARQRHHDDAVAVNHAALGIQPARQGDAAFHLAGGGVDHLQPGKALRFGPIVVGIVGGRTRHHVDLATQNQRVGICARRTGRTLLVGEQRGFPVKLGTLGGRCHAVEHRTCAAVGIAAPCRIKVGMLGIGVQRHIAFRLRDARSVHVHQLDGIAILHLIGIGHLRGILAIQNEAPIAPRGRVRHSQRAPIR